MPILKLDSNGKPVQTTQEGNGIGHVPELVESNNQYFGEVEEDKVLKDRAALAQLKAINHVNTVAKYAQDQKAEKVKELQNQKLKDDYFKAKKQKEYARNLRNQMNYLRASSQKQMEEGLSGVSGYGLTPDGRKPDLSRPSYDYVPAEQVDVAFGSYDWGQGMLVTQQLMENTGIPATDWIDQVAPVPYRVEEGIEAVTFMAQQQAQSAIIGASEAVADQAMIQIQEQAKQQDVVQSLTPEKVNRANYAHPMLKYVGGK